MKILMLLILTSCSTFVPKPSDKKLSKYYSEYLSSHKSSKEFGVDYKMHMRFKTYKYPNADLAHCVLNTNISKRELVINKFIWSRYHHDFTKKQLFDVAMTACIHTRKTDGHIIEYIYKDRYRN